jgi:peptidoglycan/LPS O-acetylase OafA/YrhL
MNRSNLDILRSIAVTLVVLDHTLLALGIQRFHSWYIADIGLFGVYMFFVHTSLVLMWSLERRPNALDFYVRRIFRLYPLAIVVILAAAFSGLPLAGQPEHYFQAAQWTWPGLLANCLFLQDFIGPYKIIHGVTWSLPPELFMYILLPGLFFYARSIRKIWPLLPIWLLVVMFDYRTFAPYGNNFAVLIPNFLCGIIAYVGFMRRRPVVPAWLFPILLAVLFLFYIRHHEFRADWYVCLTLALLLPFFKDPRPDVFTNMAETVAKYSYGVYLIHPFTIWLGIGWLAERSMGIRLAAELLPLAVLVYVGYHAIESPMIKLGARVAAKLAHEKGLPSAKSLETMEPAP